MTPRVVFLFSVTAGALLVSGCASIPARAGFDDVQMLVGARTGLPVRWSQEAAEEAEVAMTIQSMLREPLTADAAVRIALLNNRSLQATFEELGIAKADLVQAGLLHNPVFGGSIDFQTSGSSGTHTEFMVAQNVLEVIMLPLRKNVAAAQFEQVKLRVGDAVLRLAAEVRSAYYTVQGATQMLSLRQTFVQAAEAAAQLARRQREAGNINALEHASRQTVFHEAKLELLHNKADVLADRERLNQLMGLLGPADAFRFVAALPELPQTEFTLEELEALGVSQRLDLAAARQETQVLERALSVSRWGVVPEVEIGGVFEREPDRPQAVGPTFEIEVPLFDQHQAPIARSKARLRQSQERLAALERGVRSDVRLAHGRLLIARRAVEYYRETMIPLHEEIVTLSQQEYNFMLVGTYTLLEAKQDELTAHRHAIEALRDYWIGRADLERAVGGQLKMAESTVPPGAHTVQPVPDMPHAHRHGGDH